MDWDNFADLYIGEAPAKTFLLGRPGPLTLPLVTFAVPQ